MRKTPTLFDRSAVARGNAIQETVYTEFSKKELHIVESKYGNKDIEYRLALSKLSKRQEELNLALCDPDLDMEEFNSFGLGIDRFINQKEIELYPKYIEKPLVDPFRDWNKRIDCVAERSFRRFILEITSTRNYGNFVDYGNKDSKLEQAYRYLLMANELWNLNLQGILLVTFLPGNNLYEVEEKNIDELQILFPQTEQLVFS